MQETFAARLKRWKAELSMAPPLEGHRVASSALSRHISKVREAKHQMQGERPNTLDCDGLDESNR
jgi:hypothetical protein